MMISCSPSRMPPLETGMFWAFDQVPTLTLFCATTTRIKAPTFSSFGFILFVNTLIPSSRLRSCVLIKSPSPTDLVSWLPQRLFWLKNRPRSTQPAHCQDVGKSCCCLIKNRSSCFPCLPLILKRPPLSKSIVPRGITFISLNPRKGKVNPTLQRRSRSL